MLLFLFISFPAGVPAYPVETSSVGRFSLNISNPLLNVQSESEVNSKSVTLELEIYGN